MVPNRHTADALADVRAEIKQLKIQEAELRNEFLADGADRCGVQWEAVIKELYFARAIFPATTRRPFATSRDRWMSLMIEC
jgi:hypothetical protein